MKAHHFYALPIIATLSMGTAMASVEERTPVLDRQETITDTVPLTQGDGNATASGSEEDDSSYDRSSRSSSSRSSRSSSFASGEIPHLVSLETGEPLIEAAEEISASPLERTAPVETEETLNGWMNLTDAQREKWNHWRQRIGEYQEEGQFGLPADQQLQKAAELGPVTFGEVIPEEVATAIENDKLQLRLDDEFEKNKQTAFEHDSEQLKLDEQFEESVRLALSLSAQSVVNDEEVARFDAGNNNNNNNNNNNEGV